MKQKNYNWFLGSARKGTLQTFKIKIMAFRGNVT